MAGREKFAKDAECRTKFDGGPGVRAQCQVREFLVHLSRIGLSLAAGYAVAVFAAGAVSGALIHYTGVAPAQATLIGLFAAMASLVFASLLVWLACGRIERRLRKGSWQTGAMQELHKTMAIVFAATLYVIFVAGTFSVFDREIDRWSTPELRQTGEALPVPPSFDMFEAMAPGATQIRIQLATERLPVAKVEVRRSQSDEASRWLIDGHHRVRLWPRSTPFGTGFIEPLHSRFLVSQGHWLTSVAAWAWLSLVISGLVVHRRLLVDFFLLRSRFGHRALIADLHKLLGGACLMLAIVIAIGGIQMYAATIFSPSLRAFGGDPQQLEGAMSLTCPAPVEGVEGATVPVSRLIATARSEWHGSEPASMTLVNPSEPNAMITVTRARGDSMILGRDALCLRAADGALIAKSQSGGWPQDVEQLLMGLHSNQHENPASRWLQFLAGGALCLLVAMGLYHWANNAPQSGQLLRRAISDSIVLSPIAGLVTAALACQHLGGQADGKTWLFASFAGATLICAALHCYRVRWARLFTLGAIASGSIAAAASDLLANSVDLAHDLAPASIDLFLISVGLLAAWGCIRLARTDEQGPPQPC